MQPNTVTVLAGDFLAPSLLSSLDRGRGMVDVLNRVGGVGVQCVCFGNHEADVPVEDLRRRIAEFRGAWLNTNLPDFSPALPDHYIVEVAGGGRGGGGGDGGGRRVGFVGLLTTDASLYRSGVFGGALATAVPVAEAAARCRESLADCDIIVPLTHQVGLQSRVSSRFAAWDSQRRWSAW